MRSRIRNIVLLTTLIIVAIAAQKKSIPNTAHAAAATQWKFFDGNTIVSTIANDGPFNDYRRNNWSGLVWPKGTSKTAVFTSGLVIIGKHQPTGSYRTAGQNYLTEFKPGPILSTFNTTTNDLSVAGNVNDTTYRIYKITKGDQANTNPDYEHWPGHLGAPYNDLNTNGEWDKGTDTPKQHGKQMLWVVYNDLDTTNRKMMGKTKPMGLEIQAMFYGFDKPGALGNTMFMKWKLINKSDAQYDSLFVGLYSDTDMGDANDDLTGFDSSLGLAYVYNGDNNDAGASGYGATPPALGYIFLNGSPNVQLFAHPYIFKHWDEYPDIPISESANYVMMVNNMVRALKPMNGQPTLHPLTNQPTRFTMTGDPVTNTGWLFPLPAHDVRQFLSMGPVSLTPGASLEINIAFVIAQSSDRLQSLTLLRQYAAEVRSLVGSDPHFATAVGPLGAALPSDFVLEQNYPNPFNPSTTIRYSVPVQSPVTLSIFNILGKKVTELVNEHHAPGNYSAVWNGHDRSGQQVSSGVYFYTIEAGEFRETKKMLLLK